MLRLFFIVSFVVFSFSSILGQKQLTWEDFADVSFEPEYIEKYGAHFLMPSFGETIKAYDGAQVSIQGYFLDISGNGDVFLISQRPMASCFFCGGAGPETIVEVHFTEPPSFKTDQIVVVTGILKINERDVDHCNYILEKATGELVQ